MKPETKTVLRPLIAAAFCFAVIAPAAAGTIIDDWASVKAPPPPKLEQITVDPKTTALLVLDLISQTCNEKARPRCLASLPEVAKLIKGARDSKTMVVYSLIPGPSTVADVQPAVKPEAAEPVVKAGVDKFMGTDLEKILKDKGITTVIVVGTASEGAVLYTASHSAMIGLNVVVPVDGSSSATTYAEQYVAWNLVNAPVIAAKIKLTTIGMLKY